MTSAESPLSCNTIGIGLILRIPMGHYYVRCQVLISIYIYDVCSSVPLCLTLIALKGANPTNAMETACSDMSWTPAIKYCAVVKYLFLCG